jgi:hypothetical protein
MTFTVNFKLIEFKIHGEGHKMYQRPTCKIDLQTS